MFNFNFHFLIYFFKSHNFKFFLLAQEKRTILNKLKDTKNILFVFNKILKVIYLSYLAQQTFLFVSAIMMGFFIFSSVMNIFHFDNFSLGINKTWNDFLVLHYISFFIILLSLFSIISLLNAFIQIKINKKVTLLQKTYFPVSNFIDYFKEDLEKVEMTPIYSMIVDNNNLYGLLLLLVFEKHIEHEEIKLIPDYFKKSW